MKVEYKIVEVRRNIQVIEISNDDWLRIKPMNDEEHSVELNEVLDNDQIPEGFASAAFGVSYPMDECSEGKVWIANALMPIDVLEVA